MLYVTVTEIDIILLPDDSIDCLFENQKTSGAGEKEETLYAFS